MGDHQVAGEYDEYESLGFTAEQVRETITFAAEHTSAHERHRIDLDALAATHGLGPVTAAGMRARGEVIEGGEAESMAEVIEAAAEVVDRGTLRKPYRAPHNAPTVADRDLFLANFAATGVWNQSAYDTGYAGSTYKRLALEDPGFSLQVQEAIQDYREMLQMEIVRRGVRGMVKPVFGRGGKDMPDQIVGYVREFSDRLLELEAKAAWPKRYRDNVVPTDGRRFGVLVVPGTASPEDWQREALAALQKPVTRRKITKPVT